MLASHFTQIYQKTLKYADNEAAAFAITCKVEAIIDETLIDNKNAFISKQDFGSMRNEITDLHIKIAEAKINTIKCIFVLLMAQIGFVLTIIFLFLKK